MRIQAIHDMSIYLDVSHIELGCKHANIMSLYEFWEIVYLIKKDRYFIWGKIIDHENEQGNKKYSYVQDVTKVCPYMAPKKKRKKKMETFMQLTHKLGCNQQKEIKK